jgi:hypothetical protein
MIEFYERTKLLVILAAGVAEFAIVFDSKRQLVYVDVALVLVE